MQMTLRMDAVKAKQLSIRTLLLKCVAAHFLWLTLKRNFPSCVDCRANVTTPPHYFIFALE